MNIRLKPSTNSAAGQYLGYALQPVRACIRLLESDDETAVSLEYIDDVGVHYPDGRFIMEQNKSALSHNPLSDGAKDLWKTIANWIDGVAQHDLSFDQGKFVLYVTPKNNGETANLINAVYNQETADILREKVAAYLKDESPRGLAREGMKKLLELEQADFVEFVSNISITSEDDPLDQLKSLLRISSHEDLTDDVCKAVVGFAKESFDNKIRNDEQSLLQTKVFRNEIRSFLLNYNLELFYPNLVTVPDDSDVAKIRAERPTFLRQLEFVEVQDKVKDRAVSDFLMTSGVKSKWAEKGIIHGDALRNWDDQLERHFELVKTEIDVTHSDLEPTKRGRITYTKCAGHQSKLQGKEVPDHFVNGSYQSLSDERVVGWHPDYKALLSDEDQG